MCKCPSCKSSYTKRLTRRFILKLVPNAKAYKCYHCKTKFLNVPYLFSVFIFKKGKKKSGRKMIKEDHLIIN